MTLDMLLLSQYIRGNQKLKECYELLLEMREWGHTYPLSTQRRLDLMTDELGKKFERVGGGE